MMRFMYPVKTFTPLLSIANHLTFKGTLIKALRGTSLRTLADTFSIYIEKQQKMM
jgi:hypothetical protein